MRLTALDWWILGAFFALSLGIGLRAARSAGSDFASFFLAGRRQPWWLLGISMVATTFSTDTPNLVADIVRGGGVFANWTWWAFLLSGMLTVFLYAKLWRRSGVSTDIEFYELRYSGKTASFLRGFRAVYLGLLYNVLVMAAVSLAAVKIGSVMFGWSPLETLAIAAGAALIYSALGGLTGVLLTDMIQFAMAMVGSVWAAAYIVNLPEVGGLSALLEHPGVRGRLAFWPDFDALTWEDALPVFVIPLLVQWWAAYYPGSEPGGGGYVVQRMLSAKDENNAVGATLLFNLLHYALRPWPWILIALASLVVFPEVADIQRRFPHVEAQIVRNDLAYPAMLTFLPAGLLGLTATSLAAAYMSTMSTMVNWGASILVHDVYRRFLNRGASQARLVWAGRISTAALMLCACALTLTLENALQVFRILLQIGAGTGLLYLLRWFWWRINAAAELAAMISSFAVALAMQFVVRDALSASMQLLIGVAVTSACWLGTAFLTEPTDQRTLIAFYRKIRPGGPGWRPVAAAAGGPSGGNAALTAPLLASALGAAAIYGFLFAAGFALYGDLIPATAAALAAAGSCFGVMRLWRRVAAL